MKEFVAQYNMNTKISLERWEVLSTGEVWGMRRRPAFLYWDVLYAIKKSISSIFIIVVSGIYTGVLVVWAPLIT